MDKLLRERRAIFFYRWISQFPDPYVPEASVYTDPVTRKTHVVRISETGALMIAWSPTDVQTFSYNDLVAITLLNEEYSLLMTQRRVYIDHFDTLQDAQVERLRREKLIAVP